MKKLLLLFILLQISFGQYRITSPLYLKKSNTDTITWRIVIGNITTGRTVQVPNYDGTILLNVDTANYLSTYYKHGFIRKADIDSVGTITKGVWNGSTIGIPYITGLQDSLNDRYRRGDTASVLASKDWVSGIGGSYVTLATDQTVIGHKTFQDSLEISDPVINVPAVLRMGAGNILRLTPIGNLSADRTQYYQDADGTIALTKDSTIVSAGTYTTVTQSGHTATVNADTTKLVTTGTTQVITSPKHLTARWFGTSFALDTIIERTTDGMYLSLAPNGGGMIKINNNAHDNKVFLQFWDSLGTGTAVESIISGRFTGQLPLLSNYVSTMDNFGIVRIKKPSDASTQITLDTAGTGTFSSTIQATTGKFTDLNSNAVPLHLSDASGLTNSALTQASGGQAMTFSDSVVSSVGFYGGVGSFTTGTFSGDVAVNGDDITMDGTTQNVFNVTGTTVNAFGAATTVNIGASGSTVNIGAGTSASQVLAIRGQRGNVRDIRFSNGDTARWILRTNGDTETGSNAGSNFEIYRRTDTGGILGVPLAINRSTGNVTLEADLAINGDDITSDGDLTITPAGGDVIVAGALSATTGTFSSYLTHTYSKGTGRIISTGRTAPLLSEKVAMLFFNPTDSSGQLYAYDYGNSTNLHMSFTGLSFSPATTGSFDLGRYNYEWDSLYVGDIKASGAGIFGGALSATTGTFSGDVAVNGGDLTSTATTFNFLTSTVTTFNGFQAGTANTLGSTTGKTTIRNDTLMVEGDIKMQSAGQGLYIKEGTNATLGVATLSAGTVTVNTTKVTANSRIFLTIDGGTLTNVGATYVSARVAGTSFTISSTNVLDASDVAWLIIEPTTN